MKRWLPLLLGAGLIAVLALLIPFHQKPNPASPPNTDPLRPPASGSAPSAGGTAPDLSAPSASLLDRAREVLAARSPEKVQRFASELRREARTDPAFLRTLGEIVLNSSQPMEFRELAAIVLGTLAAADAQQYLSRALSASSDAAWTRTLILALGSFKDYAEDDEAFGPSVGPWAVRTRQGLIITVEATLEDLAIRTQVLSYLSGPAQVEVRDAAVRALLHSTKFGEVRRDLLQALRLETSEDLRGEIGKGLAEWARHEGVQSPERLAITAMVFEQGARREAAAVRFGAENALKAMPLTQAEVTSLASFLNAGDFDQRRWAFSILTEQASRAGLPGREGLFGTFEQILGKDASAKSREYAAAAIASFPDFARSGPLLIGALSDPAWHVRARAAESLGRLRSDDAVLGALRRVIAQDDNESVRKTAQKSLDLLSK